MLAYLAGFISVPYAMCTPVSAVAGANHDPCAANDPAPAPAHGPCATCCGGSAKESGKAHGREHTPPTCCLNCPYCYVTELPASIRSNAPVLMGSDYPAFEPSYVYLYAGASWKPPNAV